MENHRTKGKHLRTRLVSLPCFHVSHLSHIMVIKSRMSSRLPVPESTTSYWRAHPLPLDNHRTTEEVPDVVDVAIIGAGMSGACTAYHLLKDVSERPNIVIFEARQTCSGATGRNGGHSKISPVTLLAMHETGGAESTAQLTALHRRTQEGFKSCVERENIDCELYLTRSFDVFLKQEEASRVEAKIQRIREEGADWLKDIQSLGGPHVERLTGVRGAKGAISTRVCSLWPYKFVHGLLERCIDMGVNLQTHTPVTMISREADTGLSILRTPRGVTRAKKVIFASNAYVANLLPQFWDVIVPVKGTACHITSHSDGMPVLTNTYNMHPTPGNREYMIPQPDGAVVLGGGQRLYRDKKSLWFNTVDDSTQILLLDGTDVKQRFFDPYMATHFAHCHYASQDPARAPFVDMVWTGIQGYTPDQSPHVGKVPGEKDWFILAGFNGGGMASIFEVAREVARMIDSDKELEDTDLPKTFWASKERLEKGFELGQSTER